MYGMNSALPASGAAALTSIGLACTGLDVGSSLLTAFGVLLIGVALLALLRRDSKIRP